MCLFVNKAGGVPAKAVLFIVCYVSLVWTFFACWRFQRCFCCWCVSVLGNAWRSRYSKVVELDPWHRKYSKVDLDRAVALVHQGFTAYKVETMTGVPISTIRRHFLRSKAAMLCGRSGHLGAKSLGGNSGARSLEENSGARSLGENSGARSLGENSGTRSLAENSGAS